jgi:hypothetical protein
VKNSPKKGGARGRRSWRSSLLGDRGSKFFCGKLGKAKRKKRSIPERKKIPTAELNRRDQVTAAKSWPSSLEKRGTEVDRQELTGRKRRTKTSLQERKTYLTLTGLLMEGLGSDGTNLWA